jgi:hypothetical protein
MGALLSGGQSVAIFGAHGQFAEFAKIALAIAVGAILGEISMRILVSFAALLALATPVLAQTDTGLCDQEKGYIEVYKQFIEGWSDAVSNGTLVDPKKTEIAVWVTKWENRMVAGEPIRTLCLDMISKRAAEKF